MNYKYNLINLNNILRKDINEIKDYFRFNGIDKFDKNDIETLLLFSEKINNKQGFNVSYNIERLDKEFDLIKYGNGILWIYVKFLDTIFCPNSYFVFKFIPISFWQAEIFLLIYSRLSKLLGCTQCENYFDVEIIDNSEK